MTRADIAEQPGLAVDRVDDCNRVIERCGLLEIERRRPANGGRYLPSVYAVREAPNGSDCSSDDRLSPPPLLSSRKPASRHGQLGTRVSS